MSQPTCHFRSTWSALCLTALVAGSNVWAAPSGNDAPESPQQDQTMAIRSLAASLKVGDVVFIRATARPFREVAIATGSWTNHVGIVIDTEGAEPLIGESTFPFSRTTTLSRFAARSDGGRVAVGRLKVPLSPEQQREVFAAATRRAGVFYDTGFNLRSRRQFCSRYVREVLAESSAIQVGEVETFEALLARRPGTDLRFWRVWYFGRIPWQRETVTPASLLRSDALRLVFDGVVFDDVTLPSLADPRL